jgi:hypothetical protein
MENALYFPFISVPESSWFTRILLYWDKVGSIIPFEFVEAPERLSKYTRDLLIDELLIQVDPGQYVWQAPRFREAFVDFMESLPSHDIRQRRASLRNHNTFRVHTEKMQEIADYLVNARLAQRVDWSWCDVEKKTADEFMGYLAALLGKIEGVDSTPVTDTSANLDPFLLASQSVGRVEARIAALRKIVLEQLLPVPERPVSSATLRSFKQRHGERLRRFRYSIEQEVADIADMVDADLQKHRLDAFVADKKDEVQEIVAHLSEGGLGDIVFSKISAVVAAIPGMNALFGLANAVYSALSSKPQQPGSGALLYAAYVHKELK